MRDYLHTFLMDRRIIGISYPLRYFLVHHLVVPRRAPKSAAHYRTIWDASAQNFPLISHSASIAQQLAELRREPVAVGMRYGHPGTGEALEALAALPDIEEIVIVPLYPHYARSSYETAVAFALEEMRRLGLRPMRLRLQAPFYGETAYRTALADSVREYLTEPFDRLVISMHGIPLSHIPKACREHNGHSAHCADRRTWHERHGEEDCYRLQCEETRRYLAEDLGSSRARRAGLSVPLGLPRLAPAVYGTPCEGVRPRRCRAYRRRLPRLRLRLPGDDPGDQRSGPCGASSRQEARASPTFPASIAVRPSSRPSAPYLTKRSLSPRHSSVQRISANTNINHPSYPL